MDSDENEPCLHRKGQEKKNELNELLDQTIDIASISGIYTNVMNDLNELA